MGSEMCIRDSICDYNDDDHAYDHDCDDDDHDADAGMLMIMMLVMTMLMMMMMITQGGLVTFQSDLGRSWAAAWPPILPDKILNTHHTREDHAKEKYKIQNYKRKIQLAGHQCCRIKYMR